jgi:hypothetical protein
MSRVEKVNFSPISPDPVHPDGDRERRAALVDDSGENMSDGGGTFKGAYEANRLLVCHGFHCVHVDGHLVKQVSAPLRQTAGSEPAKASAWSQA